jgi:hypothetical protein
MHIENAELPGSGLIPSSKEVGEDLMGGIYAVIRDDEEVKQYGQTHSQDLFYEEPAPTPILSSKRNDRPGK